jgi:hypothetical protein
MHTAEEWKAWAVDAGERVVATFVEAFVGALLLSGVIDTDTQHKALLAGTVAAAAVVKTIVSKFLAPTGSTPAGLVALPDPSTHPAGSG